MNTITAVGWELRRILLTRTYLYSLLVVLLVSYDILNRLIINGVYGTAPYSEISYAQFLVLMNGFLITVLMLWCGAIFSERERAVRRIVLSTPVTNAGYFGIKAAAIVAAFLLTAGLVVAGSFFFFNRQFGFVAFHKFLNPLVVFMLPPAVFAIGLAMAAGQLHSRLPYGLLPLVFFVGSLNIGLPLWLDITGNAFVFNYPTIWVRAFGMTEMAYDLPTGFLVTRVLLVVSGIAMFIWAARRRCR